MANVIRNELNLIGIVIETGVPDLPEPKSFGLKRLMWKVVGGRKYSLLHHRCWRALNTLYNKFAKTKREWNVYRLERRLMESEHRQLVAGIGERWDWPIGIPKLEIGSLNNQECLNWCREKHPDLVLAFGTSILKSDMIHLPTLGVLNVHPAILPEYRGAFPEFWQVLNHDFNHTGVTIHFIDEGVDTGDSVIQQRAECSTSIDPYSLRAQNMIVSFELLPKAAKLVLDGKVERKRQGKPSTPTYRERDISLDKRIRLLEMLGYSV